MRRAGRVVAEVLALVEEELKPGVTTGHLDRLAEAHIRERRRHPVVQGLPGRQPARPFPSSLCISHRRRDRPRHPRRARHPRRPGRVDRRRRHRRRLARRRGPDVLRRRARPTACRSWSTRPARPCWPASPPPCPATTSTTSRRAVEDVAPPHGYGIVRQFVGHGIGTEMHEEPQVPNYRTGRRGRKLEPGLCLAIEPMFTLGDYAPTCSTTTGRCRPSTARWPPTSRTPSPSPSTVPRS